MVELSGEILIKNGFVVTMDRSQGIIPDGDVYVEDGRIVEVGRGLRVPSPEVVVDARNHVVMPGFVNAHSHLQQYFRGVYELMGDFFETNLPLEGYRRPDQMETLGLASCAEFIYGGCTTSLVIYTYPQGYAEAVEKAGNRCLLAADVEHVDLEKLRQGVYEYVPEKLEAGLRRSKSLHRDWHGRAGGRIKTLVCPKAPDMAQPEAYLELKEFADAHGLRMTTHLSQSAREFRHVKKLYGVTPPRHLENLGVLDHKLSAAHLTYGTPQDFQLLWRRGVSILHCHSVESPLLEWLETGFKVGVGTDDYHHDMFSLLRKQRMGVQTRASKVGGYLGLTWGARRTSRPTFYEMLELATRGGAEALGLEKEVGSLEPGKRADIITIDLANPYLTPTQDPVTSVFLYATPGDVDNVICDGRFLKQRGKLTTIDLGEALAQAQETCREIVETFFQEHPDQRDIWERMRGGGSP